MQLICLSTVLKYKFKVFVFYLSVSISCNFLLLLDLISEVSIVLFTPQYVKSFKRAQPETSTAENFNAAGI